MWHIEVNTVGGTAAHLTL